MTAARVCPHCGRALPEGADVRGLCPACLLSTAAALGDVPCPYDVISPIEQDATSVSYLARELAAARRYVVLRIFAAAVDTDAIRARFERWKPALERFRHRGAARVIDAGVTEDGTAFVASDYVAGPSLTDFLSYRTSKRADREDMSAQIDDIVAAAHRHGLAHLDLGLSRIKVAALDRLYISIVGFGVALIVDDRNADFAADLEAVASIREQLLRPTSGRVT